MAGIGGYLIGTHVQPELPMGGYDCRPFADPGFPYATTPAATHNTALEEKELEHPHLGSYGNNEGDGEPADGAESQEWTLMSNPDDDISPAAYFPFEARMCQPLRKEDIPNYLSTLKLFVGDEVIAQLVIWTNAEAQMFQEKHPGMKCIYGIKWRDVTRSEMWVFLFLSMIMSYTKLPGTADYWRDSPICSGPAVFCKEVMSRNRFLQIFKFLQFSHPRAYIRSSPLTRLGMFMTAIKSNCIKYIDPGQNVVIDQSFKGKLNFKQHIPTKCDKLDLKLFSLCPASDSLRGYTWNFALFFGKDLYDANEIKGSETLTTSERVIVHLARELLGQGRQILLDNWFMSVRLAQLFYSHNTYVFGSLRKGRVPSSLCNMTLTHHQTVFGRSKHMLLTRYEDKEPLYLLSTKHEARDYKEKVHYLVRASEVSYRKPKLVHDYNHFVSSVEAVDQIMQKYDMAKQSYPWFKKLGLHMIGRMALNAKVLYTNIHQIAVFHYSDFLIELCHQGLSENSEGYRNILEERQKFKESKKLELKRRRRKKGPLFPPPEPIDAIEETDDSSGSHPGNEQPRSKRGRKKKKESLCHTRVFKHHMANIPSTVKNKYPRRRCKHCAKTTKSKHVRTRMCCVGCYDRPALCSLECFNAYHTAMRLTV